MSNFIMFKNHVICTTKIIITMLNFKVKYICNNFHYFQDSELSNDMGSINFPSNLTQYININWVCCMTNFLITVHWVLVVIFKSTAYNNDNY